MFDNVQIVLVQPSHPGNIGAAGRAMKTMGLAQLTLVKPKQFPCAKATALAAGADDVLYQAKIYDSVSAALAQCNLVIGTSARLRSLSLPIIDPRQCATLIAQRLGEQCAILFGREDSGLSNLELQHCHYQLHIPSNPHYSSLNLAQAVQIICYELWMASKQREISQHAVSAGELAQTKEVELFYQHLEKTLIAIDFLNPNQPKRLMARLKRLFNRCQLEHTEINILRGILSKIEQRF